MQIFNKKYVAFFTLIVCLLASIFSTGSVKAQDGPFFSQETECRFYPFSVNGSFVPGTFFQPYFAGYMTTDLLENNPGREEPNAAAVRVTVSFAGTDKSVVQSDNALAAGIAAQGPDDREGDPVAGIPWIDWGYLVLLVLDGSENYPYIQGIVWKFYEWGRHTLWPIEPPEADLIETWRWSYPGVLTVESSVTLAMEWNSSHLNYFAAIGGVEYYLHSYTKEADEYNYFMLGTCVREWGPDGIKIPLGGTVKWFQFPGAWSIYNIGRSGWYSHLSFPQYLRWGESIWRNVSFAYSVDGENSWLDNTVKWGGFSYMNISAHYYHEPWSLPPSEPPNQLFVYPIEYGFFAPNILLWSMEPVDLAVLRVEPVGLHHDVVQVYHGDMRWNGTHVTMNYSVTASRIDNTPMGSVFATIGLKRTNASNQVEWVIGTSENIEFTSGTNYTREFVWSETETMQEGIWNISGFVTLIQGNCYDTNPTNNELFDGNVQAKDIGDVQGDGYCDIFDAILLSEAFGSTPGMERWNALCDLNHDGIIDIFDCIIVAEHFGERIGGGSTSGTSASTETAVTTAGTSILLEPSQLTVFKGETFTVNIKITDVTDLRGWEFKLYWNSTILNCTSAQIQTPTAWENNTLEFGPGLENNYNATHGRFWLAQAATYPAPSFNGSMTIATLTFQANETGTTALLLQDTKLGDSQAQPITHSAASGSASVYYGRYMRGDTRTVNGLNAYILNATQSNTPASYSQSADEYASVSWGIRAWIRHSNGAEAEITLDGQTGTPKAIVSRISGSGIQSSTVTVTETQLQPTDALVVRVYMKIGSGAWTQCATFTTEQLQATRLKATTWTVYYYTYAYASIRYERTTGKYYWGTPDYNSRIQNIQNN